MTLPIRLRSLLEPDGLSVRFQVEFAAPDEEGAPICAPAQLETDDGHTLDLGVLCAPTAVTWREQRSQELAIHIYASPGTHTARLHWGAVAVSATTGPDALAEEPSAARPELPLLALQHVEQQPLQVAVTLHVSGLAPERQLRIDGGAGQVRWLSGADGPDQTGEWALDYSKPGSHTVAVDLLDDDGFWLATLAESPLEVAFPVQEPMLFEEPAADIPKIAFVAPAEVPQAAVEDRPWLPFRYARPLWSGALTYTTPGGGRVSRSLGWGTHLAIKAETMIGGALWYQTGGRDWIAASAVDILQTSELRGVEFGAPPGPPPEPPPGPPPQPPPGPPSEPTGRGVVTATVLNVRARPGVRPDNPPVDQLRSGTEVDIFQQEAYAGDVWYRIGEDRWVHSDWVRRIEEPVPPPGPPPEPPPKPPPTPPSEPTGRGVVTATLLNVRARPGVRPDNPPVDQLRSGTEVDIFQQEAYAGDVWYRIGEDRWVHNDWVRRIGEPPPGPPPEPTPPSEPTGRGVVTATLLNVRARPGVRPDNPPVDQLWSGTEVDIFEGESYAGDIWYRIGKDRWVHSDWVRLWESRSRSVTAAALLTSTAGPVSLPVGWVVSQSLNVRSQPGTAPENPPVDEVYHNQRLNILETRLVDGANWHRIGQDRWVHGGYVSVARFKPRPSSIGRTERWVGICLKEQTAVAYEGDYPVYAAMVASGLPGTPTVQGIFRTWYRVASARMVGPGYYLEDVTWTCYFYAGYSLHTAYWHDAFGASRSHGCVNMSPYDAWWIFRWSEPGGPNSPAVYVYWA